MISVILFKMGKHSDFYLSFFQIVGARWDFTVVIKLTENFKRMISICSSLLHSKIGTASGEKLSSKLKPQFEVCGKRRSEDL